MKVLFCGGSPHAGSWQVRGEQVAAAVNSWYAVNAPSHEQVQTADVIVAVKRIKPELAAMLRASGKPIIWDALDFWKQPEGAANIHTASAARALAEPYIKLLEPRAIIATNKAMAVDLMGMADKVVCIYHHFNFALSPPQRADKIVVYEGMERYLDKWERITSEVLLSHGWCFACGPAEKFKPGAIFAARGGKHGSWLARRWKSNIKAANAIALGVPFLAWPEESYLETVPEDMALWFEDEFQLRTQAEKLLHPETFLHARAAALAIRKTFSLDRIVEDYTELIQAL